MVDNQLLPFRGFAFGCMSAEAEASKDPRLLTQGFVNVGGVIDELRRGGSFIVLGNKGTGKSAIAEHLKLSVDPTTFVSPACLSDFSYNDLKQIVDGEQPECVFPSAWSWLLLLTLLTSFARDEGGNLTSEPELSQMYRALDSIGLLPSGASLTELLNMSRKRQLKLELPGGFEVHGQDERQRDFRLPFFVEKLRSALLKFHSESTHLLVIDGLDDVLNLSDAHLQPLAVLVSETRRLNEAFRKADVRAKIVLLCRTDLFDRLPGSNTNKIRQDYSVRLDWYTPDPDSSPLWTVANRRASMQVGSAISIISTYFPPQLQRLGKTRVLPARPMATNHYLLRQTRFTPRDFVMLLRYIQQQSRGITVEVSDISNGLQEYATEYFLPEIRNELGGYFEPSEVTALVDAFGTIRDSLFSLAHLEDQVPQYLRPALPRMLRVLFDCSAIGNWERGDDAGRRRTYRYKYPNCRLDLNEAMVLHPALGLAFNVVEHSDGNCSAGTYTNKRAGDQRISNELQGMVKTVERSHGFIVGTNGQIFFFKHKDVLDHEEMRLCVGDHVTFQKAQTERRTGYPPAVNVRFRGREMR